jgi:hypothetical protein
MRSRVFISCLKIESGRTSLRTTRHPLGRHRPVKPGDPVRREFAIYHSRLGVLDTPHARGMTTMGEAAVLSTTGITG